MPKPHYTEGGREKDVLNKLRKKNILIKTLHVETASPRSFKKKVEKKW